MSFYFSLEIIHGPSQEVNLATAACFRASDPLGQGGGRGEAGGGEAGGGEAAGERGGVDMLSNNTNHQCYLT